MTQFQAQAGLPLRESSDSQCLGPFLDRRYLQHECSKDTQSDQDQQSGG